ncbi:unnamed protein product, partial [Gadus morhua 'NCC']
GQSRARDNVPVCPPLSAGLRIGRCQRYGRQTWPPKRQERLSDSAMPESVRPSPPRGVELGITYAEGRSGFAQPNPG